MPCPTFSAEEETTVITLVVGSMDDISCRLELNFPIGEDMMDIKLELGTTDDVFTTLGDDGVNINDGVNITWLESETPLEDFAAAK